MRTLFAKIFFSFWLSMILIVGLTFLASERPHMQARDRWQSSMARSLSMSALALVHSYEQLGCAEVSSYMKDLAEVRRVRAFLIDVEGRSLCSSHAAPASALSAAATARRNGATQFTSAEGDKFAAQRAAGKDGRYYALVIKVPLFIERPLFRAALPRLLIHILVSALICFWLARYLIAPILRLRAAAHQLAQGDLSARAGAKPGKAGDEIAELVKDFDYMADRLETVISSQRLLIRDMSHELRSPLARLSFALALARRNGNQENTEALDRIERESRRLNSMIGNMLILSRLEAGDENVEKAEVDVSRLVQEVIDDADFEAKSRNCRVRCTLLEECCALANEQLLRSAIENVVRNAVHYTAENSQVTVTVSFGSDNLVAITVTDQGPGVPESELANLFRPFYRVDSARDRQTGGVGLGLAIADRAIRLHQGSLVAAIAPGGGLKLTITFPAERLPGRHPSRDAVASP